MSKIDELIGKTFDRLTVEERAPNKSGHIYYICLCECGKIVTVRKQNLVNDITRSCGCYRTEKIVERSIAFNTFIRMGNITKMFDNSGNTCLINTGDIERVSSMYWSQGTQNYWLSQRNRTKYKLHRFIMNCPNDMEVDHLDGDPTNNTQSNLRICSHAENSKNRKVQKNNALGITGVTYISKTNKYRARIKVKGKYIYLGYFNSIEEAEKERTDAEIKYFGEFRRGK